MGHIVFIFGRIKIIHCGSKTYSGNYRKDVTAGKIFVTVFLDFKTYKKFSEELAWDTEVWIAEMPEHMIHLNGDKFMGPR